MTATKETRPNVHARLFRRNYDDSPRRFVFSLEGKKRGFTATTLYGALRQLVQYRMSWEEPFFAEDLRLVYACPHEPHPPWWIIKCLEGG